MDGKMVWALGGVGCAGGGWEGADIFDSGRREEGQRYRDLYSVCVCSCSAHRVLCSRAATVWSCAHKYYYTVYQT